MLPFHYSWPVCLSAAGHRRVPGGPPVSMHRRPALTETSPVPSPWPITAALLLAALALWIAWLIG